MRRHPIAGLGVVAILGGVLLAFVLALTVGGGDGGRAGMPPAVAGADPLAPATPSAGDPRRPSEAPPRRDVRGCGQGWMKAIGPVRIEARAPDPRGGPPFAVRVFASQDLRERCDGSGTLYPGGKPDRCAQLGRIHKGRFGWIDARNVFRPAGIVWRAAPVVCGSLAADLGREPLVDVLNRMTDPTRSAAAPIQSVVWGIAGADGRVEVEVDGVEHEVPRTRNGAVLIPLAGDVRRRPLMRTEIRYPEGRPVVLERNFRVAGEERPALFGRGRRGDAVPESRRPRPDRAPTLEYQVPDPSGGLPWGVMAAPVPGGGWCVSGAGRVIGERVAGILDGGLGTFTDATPANGRGCGHLGVGPTRRFPLPLNYMLGVGGGEPRGAVERRARVERRSMGAPSVISGVAHPDIVSITVASSAGVRTVAPSRRANAIVVVEQGSAPGTGLDISARMRDGSVHRQPPFRMP